MVKIYLICLVYNDLWRFDACNITCVHGTCEGENNEICNCIGTGYEGINCQITTCTPSCLHGGDCASPNICDCGNTGYTGDHCQEDINECNSTSILCDPLTVCINIPGSFDCSPCPKFYRGNGKTECVFDPCNLGACSGLVTCSKLNDSYYECGPCPRFVLFMYF